MLLLIIVELQALAHEVQALVQAKIGTTAYSAVHSSIRQKMAERRNERKTTLALQVRFAILLSLPIQLIFTNLSLFNRLSMIRLRKLRERQREMNRRRDRRRERLVICFRRLFNIFCVFDTLLPSFMIAS